MGALPQNLYFLIILPVLCSRYAIITFELHIHVRKNSDLLHVRRKIEVKYIFQLLHVFYISDT